MLSMEVQHMLDYTKFKLRILANSLTYSDEYDSFYYNNIAI